jgi:hypothetical protein
MPLIKITTKLTLERRQWTQYSREAPPGSGYCEDQGVYRRIVKSWHVNGLKVWSREIDREDEPAHVWIHEAVFGGAGGWTSRFKGMPGVFWKDGKPA